MCSENICGIVLKIIDRYKVGISDSLDSIICLVPELIISKLELEVEDIVVFEEVEPFLPLLDFVTKKKISQIIGGILVKIPEYGDLWLIISSLLIHEA